MRQEDILKEKFGVDPGFKVPEGYFADLNKNILNNLPPYKLVPEETRISTWQRYKPYFYLAAMFGGIWLMMKVFHEFSGASQLNLDNPPQAIVQLIEDGQYPEYYGSYNDEPEFILEEEVISEYDSIEDFENDFGYSLKPEYSALNIETIRNENRNV